MATFTFDFDRQCAEWQRVPVDDVGYIPARDLLAMPDSVLRRLVTEMELVRYTGWRNHDGAWRRCLGLDDTHDKTVLDFGCGLGVEALQFARAGNHLVLADINDVTVALARRVLNVFGFEPDMLMQAIGEAPYIADWPVDVFYANGVLHHTPDAPRILARARELLNPGGEVRLMLYTDRAWSTYTDTDPPGGDPRAHPAFERFVREFDQVGFYAEPWWPEKLEQATAGYLRLVSWDYLTPNDRYAAARLVAA